MPASVGVKYVGICIQILVYVIVAIRAKYIIAENSPSPRAQSKYFHHNI